MTLWRRLAFGPHLWRPDALICERCGVTVEELTAWTRELLRNKPGRIVEVPAGVEIERLQPLRWRHEVRAWIARYAPRVVRDYELLSRIAWVIPHHRQWRTCPRWHLVGYAIFAAVLWGLIPK